MSQILDKYRSQAHGALVALRDGAMQDMQNGVSFRRAVYGGQQHIPASTCEEIAMIAVQQAARIRALNEAIEALNETYKRLFEKDDDGE